MIPWHVFLFPGLFFFILGYLTRDKSPQKVGKRKRVSWNDPDLGRSLNRISAKTLMVLGGIFGGFGTLLLIIDTIIKYTK